MGFEGRLESWEQAAWSMTHLVPKKRFKYGFEVPETVAQAIELNKINGNCVVAGWH